VSRKEVFSSEKLNQRAPFYATSTLANSNVKTFLALRRRSAVSPALELLASTLQLLGTVFFLGPEFMTGCKNMQPFGPSPHGCFPPPLDSLWTAFYWHFGIGVNAVWVFIPLLLGARAVADTATGTSILLSQQAMVEMRRSRERIRNYKTL